MNEWVDEWMNKWMDKLMNGLHYLETIIFRRDNSKTYLYINHNVVIFLFPTLFLM
jgi:hypothetical protein